MKSVYIHMIPCSRRSADTALLTEYFKANKWKIACRAEDANLILVHTCGYSQYREDVSIDAISRMKTIKRAGSRMVVCGCLPRINVKRLRSVFNGAVFSPRDMDKIDEIINSEVKLADVKEPNAAQDYLYPQRSGIKVFNISVVKGCRGKCSYCAIKFAIGKFTSKPVDKIIAEFKGGLRKGYKLFRIMGEDVGAYGIDKNTTVIELLTRIFRIKGDHKLIIDDFNAKWAVKYFDELKSVLNMHKNLLHHILIPIQSGSDRILRLMGREHTAGDIINCLRVIERDIPDIKIHTHIMVGFPGETDKDFKDTLKLIFAYPFSYVDICRYSGRPDTLSEKMPGKIDENTKRMREKVAKATWLKLYRRYNKGTMTAPIA